ncbi:hypothetical protein OROMI_025287 [Orobanche minor]
MVVFVLRVSHMEMLITQPIKEMQKKAPFSVPRSIVHSLDCL